MNPEQIAVVEACVHGALTDTLSFPQIVARLTDAGIERYHADYSRGEITYYLPDGASRVVAAPHDPAPTADAFSPAGVEAAVRQSQRGEHTYADFVRKTKAAGCVGYFVQITGRRAVYFGRNGETHVERFPEPAAVAT